MMHRRIKRVLRSAARKERKTRGVPYKGPPMTIIGRVEHPHGGSFRVEMQVHSRGLWKRIKRGEVRGMSVGGRAVPR